MATSAGHECTRDPIGGPRPSPRARPPSNLTKLAGRFLHLRLLSASACFISHWSDAAIPAFRRLPDGFPRFVETQPSREATTLFQAHTHHMSWRLLHTTGRNSSLKLKV